MPYRVNKQKCTGCQLCIRNCPGATKIGVDDKAEVVDQKKLEECGGENVCPMWAIEKIDEEEPETKTPSQPAPQTPSSYQPSPSKGRGLGRGRGPGYSRGMGRKGRGKGRRNW